MAIEFLFTGKVPVHWKVRFLSFHSTKKLWKLSWKRLETKLESLVDISQQIADNTQFVPAKAVYQLYQGGSLVSMWPKLYRNFLEIKKMVPMFSLGIEEHAVQVWSEHCQKHWSYSLLSKVYRTTWGAASIFSFEWYAFVDGKHRTCSSQHHAAIELVTPVILTSTTRFYRLPTKW